MNSLFRGPNDLNIGSSILTRRGGTDATAHECPLEAIPRVWHVGILGPQFLENPGKAASRKSENIEQFSKIVLYPRKWADDEWRRNQIWLRTISKGSQALNP